MSLVLKERKEGSSSRLLTMNGRSAFPLNILDKLNASFAWRLLSPKCIIATPLGDTITSIELYKYRNLLPSGRRQLSNCLTTCRESFHSSVSRLLRLTKWRVPAIRFPVSLLSAWRHSQTGNFIRVQHDCDTFPLSWKTFCFWKYEPLTLHCLSSQRNWLT